MLFYGSPETYGEVDEISGSEILDHAGVYLKPLLVFAFRAI